MSFFEKIMLNINKSLGNRPSIEDEEYFKKVSLNHEGGKFVNKEFKILDEKVKVIKKSDYFKSLGNKKLTYPKKDKIPIIKLENVNAIDKDKISFIWLGHSSIILKINSKVILIDPVLSNNASPVNFLIKRFYKDIPIKAEELTSIDAVIISHNHYDHLDYETIKKIKDKTKVFYTTLGVDSYIKSFGVAEEKIKVLNWFEEDIFDDLKIIATPSVHFSGRYILDNNKSNWASFIIENKEKRIFYSSDTDYGKHFKEINNRYGKIDLAFMECGQYNDLWPEVHMMPEETFKASLDIEANYVVPIHWGAFSLSSHAWNEPPIKFESYLNKEFKTIIPKIGEEVFLESFDDLREKWYID